MARAKQRRYFHIALNAYNGSEGEGPFTWHINLRHTAKLTAVSPSPLGTLLSAPLLCRQIVVQETGPRTQKNFSVFSRCCAPNSQQTPAVLSSHQFPTENQWVRMLGQMWTPHTTDASGICLVDIINGPALQLRSLCPFKEKTSPL